MSEKPVPGGCFPASLQLPHLSSAELSQLRDDLAKQIAEERPRDSATAAPARAVITLTTNRAATFEGSGCARTDLFFKIKRSDNSDSAEIHQLLQQAWEEDPLDTLKLVAHLRDVRGGKGEQKLFHECVAWMRRAHPLTLIANLAEIVKVGYWKDLLEIVVRTCVSPETMEERAQQGTDRKLKSRSQSNKYRKQRGMTGSDDWRGIPELKEMRKKSFRKHVRSLKTKSEREEAQAERAKQITRKHQLIVDFVAGQKKQKRAGNIEKTLKDPVSRLLHISVAVLFAEQLQKDLEALKQGEAAEVSLAAKWAPTPKHSHDKDTLLAATIAEFLYPASTHQLEGEAYEAYVTRIKAMYHKQALVPLRRCLDVPEVYMSARAWDEVKYPRVPSVCMKNNKGRFEEHDQERFAQYLADVRAGKKKIASGALKPHELVSEAMKSAGLLMMRDFMDEDEVAAAEGGSSVLGLETMELQWKSYVNNLKASGTLSNALAICDVSGSMSGEPMEVAIALSLLVAEVTAPPFNEMVCTFSSKPQLHAIKGDSLVHKVKDLQGMDWGMSTNINAVFRLILDRAVTSNIPPEAMIQTLFLFSDMQFDMAAASTFGQQPAGNATNFQVAKAQFEEAGYTLPKIVFWNLRGDFGTSPVPVTHREDGTALVSGFSGQMLKLFMAAELETFNPFTVMQEAISADKYNGWKLVD